MRKIFIDDPIRPGKMALARVWAALALLELLAGLVTVGWAFCSRRERVDA